MTSPDGSTSPMAATAPAPPVTVPLPLHVAVELAHGAVAEAFAAAGIRGIFFKGPIAHSMGLRQRSQSSDVDVLVDPRQEEAAFRCLADHGWRERPMGGDLGVGLVHAQTLLHDEWPVDIDLHRRIPGIEVPADEAFDTLWKERLRFQLAHVTVPAPSRAAHALILALNGLRAPWEQRARNDLRHLLSVLYDEDWKAIDTVARALDASRALSPLVVDHAPDGVEPDLRAPSHEWLLYQHLEHPAVLWLDAARRAPLSQLPCILWRALFPSTELLVKRDLSLQGAPAHRLMEARRTRWKKFVRTLPRILQAARRLRREKERSSR